MPRRALGARLYFDRKRESWIIRDGTVFIRTGARGWKKAEQKLAEYIRDRPATVPARVPTQGFVYFVTAEWPDYPIKIGFAERVSSRTGDLQTTCPYPIVLLATFAGTYQDESGLHRQFKADRLCGEWFRRSPKLMALIDQHLAKRAA